MEEAVPVFGTSNIRSNTSLDLSTQIPANLSFLYDLSSSTSFNSSHFRDFLMTQAPIQQPSLLGFPETSHTSNGLIQKEVIAFSEQQYLKCMRQSLNKQRLQHSMAPNVSNLTANIANMNMTPNIAPNTVTMTPNTAPSITPNVAPNVVCSSMMTNQRLFVNPEVRLIAVNFVGLYYQKLNQDPYSMSRFYFSDAQVVRFDLNNTILQPRTNDPNDIYAINKLLGFQESVRYVDVKYIHYQSSVANSILITIDGNMIFQTLNQRTERSFSQIFSITKCFKGYWLINNDVLRFQSMTQKNIINYPINAVCATNRVNNTNHLITQPITNINNNNKLTYSTIAAKSDLTNVGNRSLENDHVQNVDKRMINRFYHDASYQNFNNEYAIYVRSVPNSATHQEICLTLERAFQLHAQTKNEIKEDIMISYIDVNYHKAFAFVYLGNHYTLKVALEVSKVCINGQMCELQKKRSHNGPRRFPPNNQLREL